LICINFIYKFELNQNQSIMKKTISILLSLLFVVAFTECKKESDTLTVQQILGKWEITSDKTTEYENSVKTFEDTYTYSANESVFEIFSNGTGKHYSYGVKDDDFTWTLSGNILTVVSTSMTIGLDVSVNGNNMTFVVTDTYVSSGITYKSVTVSTAKKIAK
jgi:hypothetical protein